MTGRVIAVAKDADHGFSKQSMSEIRLLPGLGVEGDAHHGVTVQHRSRVAADPTRPNLRQVHLMHCELFGELLRKGFVVGAAELGENVTTQGIDLLGLSKGTLLKLGEEAVLEVTGLRNPCAQIERFRPGLLAAVLDRAPNGGLVRKAGIMAVVRMGGVVHPDDPIEVQLSPIPHIALEPV